MAVDYGTGYIDVEPRIDQAQAQGQMQSGLGGAMSKVGPKLAVAGAAMTAGITVPLINAGMESIHLAANLEDVAAAAEVTFGKASGSVSRFADTALQKFGITETAALEAANQFGAVGKSAGLEGPGLAKFSTQMVGLAGDLSSFTGRPVEDALTAVGAGLRGESEPLRAFGVLLDDASLRAEAMRQGLVKTTDEALTPQQKVLAAQALILKQTGDAQGDFVRTSDSAANSMKVMSGTIEELKAGFGEALLPVVKSVTGFLTPLLEKFDTMSPTMKTVIVVVLGIVAALGPLLLILGTIITIAPAIGAAVTFMFGPWGLLIAAVIVGIILIVKNFGTLKRVAIAVWNAIKGAAIAVWNAIKAAALAVFNFFKAAIRIYLWPYQQVWKLISSAAKAAFGLVKSAASTLFGWLKDGWEGVKDVATGIWDAISTAFDAVMDAIRNVWNSTVGGFGFEVPGWVPGVGGNEFRIPEMAEGGIVRRPMLALLGEAGPEAVVPLSQLGAVAGSGRARITGTLQLTPDSTVFIRGVAADEDEVARRRDRSVARMNPRGRSA